jgi:hypothetical protein
MHRTFTAILIVLLLVPALPAKSNPDWNNLKNQKPGTPVQIFLWGGDILFGQFEDATDSDLRIATRDTSGSSVNWLRAIQRSNIQQITCVRKPNLPDPRKWMLVGAAAGGAVGLAGGAIADARNGGGYHWFEGAFGGALFGFLISCGALTSVAGVTAARDLHRGSLIYKDSSNRPLHP